MSSHPRLARPQYGSAWEPDWPPRRGAALFSSGATDVAFRKFISDAPALLIEDDILTADSAFPDFETVRIFLR